MLPVLEVRAGVARPAWDGREANDARLGQTADSPGPDHADTLEAVRLRGDDFRATRMLLRGAHAGAEMQSGQCPNYRKKGAILPDSLLFLRLASKP